MTELALEIARAVREAGGRALIVGGWVRDRLMGSPSKDIDVEVFRAAAQEAVSDESAHAPCPSASVADGLGDPASLLLQIHVNSI